MDEKKQKISSIQNTVVLVFVIVAVALVLVDVGIKLDYEITTRNVVQLQAGY